MTIWRTKKEEKLVIRHLHIEGGILSFYRNNGAITRLDIDALESAKLLVIGKEIYWYLEDQDKNFVLVPENLSDIGLLRRYLSSWRGFNYDGLLRFDMTQQTELVLYPLSQAHAA